MRPEDDAGAAPGHRTLRIALVTQGFQSAGGVRTVARWIHGELERAGHHVEVFDLATSRRDADSRLFARPRTWRRGSLLHVDETEPGLTHVGANGGEVEVLRYLPRRELDEALRGFDLVQVVAGGPALALVAARSGVPVALQVATTAHWERRTTASSRPRRERAVRSVMTGLVSVLERAALRRTTMVFVENQRMRSHVARAAPDTEVVLAPPGVDTTFFLPADGGWAQDGYLLSVCRFGDPRKGLDRLVRAYGLLRSQDPTMPDLVLAGRNQLPAALRDQIDRLELTAHVRVLSEVPAQDLPALYRGASLFLQTSWEEGLGMSVIEAMACGLPVVATETAGSRETVVDDVTGVMVLQAGPVEHHVADAVRRIRRGDGAAMARFARHRAETVFSTTATVEAFMSGYARMVRPGAPTSPSTGSVSKGLS